MLANALKSVRAAGAEIIKCACPQAKMKISHEAAAAWKSGRLAIGGTEDDLPDLPARPVHPHLVDKIEESGPVTLSKELQMLHALAHIELGAVDNYWDTVARFSPEEHSLPREYVDDLVQVADDEARHFGWLDAEMKRHGSYYGAMPAHKRLLSHARNTQEELLARLAVIPLVQEARGLDSGPRLIAKLKSMKAKESARVVGQIVEEEEAHVRVGMRWFTFLCEKQYLNPAETFHKLVLEHFPRGLPPPFAEEARRRAGMPPEFYRPLVCKD